MAYLSPLPRLSSSIKSEGLTQTVPHTPVIIYNAKETDLRLVPQVQSPFFRTAGSVFDIEQRENVVPCTPVRKKKRSTKRNDKPQEVPQTVLTDRSEKVKLDIGLAKIGEDILEYAENSHKYIDTVSDTLSPEKSPSVSSDTNDQRPDLISLFIENNEDLFSII